MGYQLSQMQKCEEKLKQEQARLQIFQEELQDSQNKVQASQSALEDSRNQVQILNKELQDNQNQIYRLKEELRKKTSYIEEVQTGIGWRILIYYRKNIRNRLAPEGTKRRIVYDKLLKRFKFREKGHPEHHAEDRKSGALIKQEQFIVPAISDETVEAIDIKVSVIIPTKNAGQDFYHVLESIKKQKGIKDIELIIVDSGSEDDTLNLSKRYRA